MAVEPLTDEDLRELGLEDLRAERRRVGARKKRALAALDRELQRYGHQPPRPTPGRSSERTTLARLRVQAEHAGALRSWRELREAVIREGGIHPNRDYASSEVPREVRARKGYGLAPDEMAQVLTARGFHYAYDDELITDLQWRRDRVRETHVEYERIKPRTGPSIVCVDACRNDVGMFTRCDRVLSRALRYCNRRLRDALGRFNRQRR